MQVPPMPGEDLEQQLKAYRRNFEARKAARLGTSPAPTQSSTYSSPQPNAAAIATPGPRVPVNSQDMEGIEKIRAPRLGSGEAFRKSCSPLVDLATPASPISGARAWMLNASLSERAPGASSPLAAPVLQEPTPSQRPVHASPKKGPGAFSGTEQGEAAARDERPSFPDVRELSGPSARERTPREGPFCLPPPQASAPQASAPQAPAQAPAYAPAAQVLPQAPQPLLRPAPPQVPPLPVARSAVARPPPAAACQGGGTAEEAPLERVAAEPVVEEQDLQVLKRLRQVQEAIAAYDQELEQLANLEESELDDGLANLWEVLGSEPLAAEQLQQELAETARRVAKLEEQLARAQSGGPAAALDEAPSDASTSATPWGASLEDGAWQQKAEVLRDEVMRQSALATEIQDRIHWLRAQLRRQPGLHDRRVQEIVVLLAEIAEVVPRNQRVDAIRELLAEIAEQAAATEVV